MCYLATQQLTGYFEGTRMHEGSRVVVEFDIGFYMITAAGAVSVIAVGSTLLQVYNPSPSSSRGWSRGSASDSADRRREQLLHDADACRLSQAIHTRIQPPRAPPPYRP